MTEDICLIGRDKIKNSSLQVLTEIMLLKLARTGAIAPDSRFKLPILLKKSKVIGTVSGWTDTEAECCLDDDAYE